MNIPKIHSTFFSQALPGLCLAFFCLCSLGQFQRLEWGSLPAFYLHEVVLVGYCLWHGRQRSWWNRVIQKLAALPWICWIVLGWIAIGEVLAGVKGTSLLYPVLYLSRVSLYGCSSYCLWQDLRKNPLLKTSIWLGLLSFFALIVYFGLLQFIFVPDTRFLFFLGWDDHYARLLSTLFDPGFTGLICCLGGLIALDWLISQDHTQEHWQLKSSSLVVLISGCALACLLTYSRATFLTFVSCCGLLSLWFWQKNLRLSLCSLAVAIVFISAIFSLPRPGGEGVKLERTSTITSRTSAATAVLATLRSPSDWLVGHGLFQPVSEAASLYSETTSHGKQPDNWVILLLSGVGVVGSGLIFVSLWMLGRRIFFSRKLIGVGVLAIAIHGLFNASLTYPFVLLVMGTWAALTLES